MTSSRFLVLIGSALVAACGGTAQLPETAGMGPNPELPPPTQSLIPTVHVAPAKGWPAGVMPIGGARHQRSRVLATGLDHPRWVYVLPNGDVLVAETAAPPRPEKGKGVKAKAMGYFMKKAGSAVPSANRITLLRDVDGDGVAEVRTVFLEGLNSPFGIALVGNDLYVANTDAIVRYPVRAGATRITAPGAKVTDLPGGPRNHHWTKNVIASRATATKLYATVGSNSNVAENGMAEEEGRAAIWESRREDRRQAPLRHGAAQSERHGPGSRRPARSGRWSTSATSSAATSCPTTSPRCSDGGVLRLAVQLLRRATSTSG